MKERNLIALLILTIFVLVVLWASYLFLANKDQEEQTPADAIAKIGEEYIYQADIDYLAKIKFNLFTDEQILNEVIDDSILLQLAAKEGWIRLDSNFFNSKNKDFIMRYDNLRKVKESFEYYKTAGTYLEEISVWFWGQGLGQ